MRKITRAQYLQLVGLIAASAREHELLKSIERAALLITDEKNMDGTPADTGHTLDMVWGSRGIDEGLRLIDIEVEPEPPPSPHERLFKFYRVNNVDDLIDAQARHVERLQEKLPPDPPQYGKPREG